MGIAPVDTPAKRAVRLSSSLDVGTAQGSSSLSSSRLSGSNTSPPATRRHRVPSGPSARVAASPTQRGDGKHRILVLSGTEVPIWAMKQVLTAASGVVQPFIVLKPAPLAAAQVDDVLELLSAGVHAIYVTLEEANALLRAELGKATASEAEGAARLLIARHQSLTLAMVRCGVGVVLVERVGAEDFRVLILPNEKVRGATYVNLAGASDAFLGGFIAAKARGLSTGQALLWAHGAGMLCALSKDHQLTQPASELISFLEHDTGLGQDALVRRESAERRATAPPGGAPRHAASSIEMARLIRAQPLSDEAYLLQNRFLTTP